MNTRPQSRQPQIDGKILSVSRWFPRIASIRSEHFDIVDSPSDFIAAVRAGVRAELFTFLQPVSEPKPLYPYHLEWDEKAVLSFESYESWWKQQLNDKTRNMVRKAGKKGIEIRVTPCDDELIKGIKEIYDESPVRQGKPFRHYGKDLATLRSAHITFLERSEFIGAYFEGKLVGFIKMVYHKQSASIMQIIAMYKHRDKAPTNALLAKAVEICSERNIHFIQYGIWSRRSLGEFKKHNCFDLMRVPRYYVPLNLLGAAALRLRLHRRLIDILPDGYFDWLARLRSRWYARQTASDAD